MTFQFLLFVYVFIDEYRICGVQTKNEFSHFGSTPIDCNILDRYMIVKSR